jgi:hypothetical protein
MHERFVVVAAVSAAGFLCSACPKLVQGLLGAAAARLPCATRYLRAGPEHHRASLDNWRRSWDWNRVLSDMLRG